MLINASSRQPLSKAVAVSFLLLLLVMIMMMIMRGK